MLQRSGGRKQEKQHGPFSPSAHRRAARGDGEHEEMNVEYPRADFGKGLLRGKPASRKKRNHIERHRPCWRGREVAGQSENRA
jgi:hypothetical protein